MKSEHGYSLIEMMGALGLIGVLAAFIVPITDSSIRSSRLRGEAGIVRNLVGLAKMRASAQFTRARVYADLATGSYVLQVWDKTSGTWVDDGGLNRLSPDVSFGFGTLTEPPPNTQVDIAQSPACTDGLTSAGPIADTACVTFNSRGLPVDADGNLFPRHALYLIGTDGVFATTITTTPLIRFWSSPRLEEPVWTAR
jgi:prepilin-type N-terminal cleavage/methylation domain-containing protein